ncbi:hypothetical protein C3Y89_22015 [Rhizobium sp. UPM1132]|nr:hypothetical protein [Rhizobium ruizarguesonis]NKQ77505.1 hypothetical protein [Rhizobium ruizarguesonis]
MSAIYLDTPPHQAKAGFFDQGIEGDVQEGRTFVGDLFHAHVAFRRARAADRCFSSRSKWAQ